MKKIIALFGLLVLPVFAFAAGTITDIIVTVVGWTAYIVPVLMTLAIAYFIWGVIQFITASDEEAKKMGRTKIINGLIGLFVIVSFWGIIAVVKKTFDINSYGVANTAVDSIDTSRMIRN